MENLVVKHGQSHLEKMHSSVLNYVLNRQGAGTFHKFLKLDVVHNKKPSRNPVISVEN